jgi:tRNA (guanine26-N2/guanine27-N2)-dimethyltransferase
VFYNPAMAADRDLAVAFVRAWAGGTATGYAGWEVTAATGVRGLRLLGESGAFRSFVLTEQNDEAYDTLARNARDHPGAIAVHGDGRTPPPGAPFDYVDIDPYGSPIPFAPAALTAVREGGVVAVTATDMMVLAGAQPAAAVRRYGAVPVRGRLGPESALRILLMFLAREARLRNRRIRPLLSYVREHYVRTYVELGPRDVTPDPVAWIDPAAWAGPPVGSKGPYGPLWLGPLSDPAVVTRLSVPESAAQPSEVGAFVVRLAGEAAIDQAFYYEPNSIAATLRLPSPPAREALLEALIAAGFRAARTHVRPEGIRTDAPRSAVERIATALSRNAQSQNARVRA